MFGHMDGARLDGARLDGDRLAYTDPPSSVFPNQLVCVKGIKYLR